MNNCYVHALLTHVSSYLRLACPGVVRTLLSRDVLDWLLLVRCLEERCCGKQVLCDDRPRSLASRILVVRKRNEIFICYLDFSVGKGNKM